jgi:hypothetical protein
VETGQALLAAKNLVTQGKARVCNDERSGHGGEGNLGGRAPELENVLAKHIRRQGPGLLVLGINQGSTLVLNADIKRPSPAHEH